MNIVQVLEILEEEHHLQVLEKNKMDQDHLLQEMDQDPPLEEALPTQVKNKMDQDRHLQETARDHHPQEGDLPPQEEEHLLILEKKMDQDHHHQEMALDHLLQEMALDHPLEDHPLLLHLVELVLPQGNMIQFLLFILTLLQLKLPLEDCLLHLLI